MHLLQIAAAGLAVQGQKGKLPLFRYPGALAAVKINGQAVVIIGHFESEIAAAGVDHEPDMTIIPLLDLDKMVAAPQGSELGQGAVILVGNNGKFSKWNAAGFRHQGRFLFFFMVLEP